MSNSTHSYEFIIDQHYLLVRQQGVLAKDKIKLTLQQSKPLFEQHLIKKVLLDYRRADLSRMSLIELDDLAQELPRELPNCFIMAITYDPTAEPKIYQHIKNVCSLCSVEIELFTDIGAAKKWLFQQPIPTQRGIFASQNLRL